jgi:hypothetical protein
MSTVTEQYVNSLPEIYRDILASFPAIEPARSFGDGLTYQTLYSHLHEKWSMTEILQACEQMSHANAVILRMRLFVCPTDFGEQIIASLTGKKPSVRQVPAFPLPNG